MHAGLGKLDWEFSGIVSAGFHVETGWKAAQLSNSTRRVKMFPRFLNELKERTLSEFNIYVGCFL